jgi:hypothetical protein
MTSPGPIPPLHTCTWQEFDDVPGWQLVPEARELLNLTTTQLAAHLGVDPQTVWRWQRDPARHPDSHRVAPATVRRVLFWMLRPGRPDDWPLPPPAKGGAS